MNNTKRINERSFTSVWSRDSSWTYPSSWSPVWRCLAWPMGVAPSLLTSSGSNCTRHRSTWLRWGSAGLRGSSSQRQCRLCVRGRRMCVEAPGVCAWAHRIMGEEWASALTRFPTHTRRELQRNTGREEAAWVCSCLLCGGERLKDSSVGVWMSLFWN